MDLCAETADFIRNESLHFDRKRIEQKDTFSNLVSYVDKESEKKIVSSLKKILPGAGFLAEEGTQLKGENEYQWIIDPLDGTTNFLHGVPIFAISIALMKMNKPVVGVIYEVSHNECFHATEGGAFLNKNKIRVSPIADLRESLLATGFPYYHTEKKNQYLDIIKTFLERTHGIRRFGSAAIDLAYVACGRLEGFFEYDLNAWDVAAGTFILEQAGGKVSDFKGGTNFIFGRELCAAGNIHADMLKIIGEHWWT